MSTLSLAAPEQAPSPIRRATSGSLLAAALFALMGLGVRAVSDRIPGPQIAAVRFAVGLAAVVLLAVAGHIDLRPRRWGWLASRGLAGGLAVVAYFACIQHVGLAVATLLNHTGPMWSLLFAWALLGERPQARAFGALGITLFGVMLVVGGTGALGIGLWEAVGVFSAITTGVAVTSIRAVRRPSAAGLPVESSWTVFASFTGLGLLATLPFVVGRWVAPTPREWAILLGTALTSVAAQLAMTAALAVVTAVASGIMLQLTVVLSLLGGIVFYGERLDLRTGTGALLTMAGVMWMVLASAPAPRRERPSPAR